MRLVDRKRLLELKTEHACGRAFEIRYFSNWRRKGFKTYSAEIQLGIGLNKKVVLDDGSLEALKNKVAEQLPGIVMSHSLAYATHQEKVS